MNKLLKDAIADAKAVRETALANAKLALEEAFAPKLQSMLSHKIKEEMADDEEKATMEAETEEQDEMARMQELAGLGEEEGEEMDSEMDSEEEMDSEMDSEMEDEMDSEMEDEMEDEMESEEDADLEEILRELDAETSEEESEEETMMEAEEEEYSDESEEEDEEVNLEELIQALREGEDGEEEEEEEMEEPKVEGKMKNKMKKMEEDLNEAYSAVKFLRTKLSEVNLLNAKLLYVNKLFRNNLTETQKVKIIETFDRAKTVREAKLVFATLSESLSAAKGSTKQNATKKSVMESFASKATAKTKSVLTEGNDQANRFKKLAGII